MSAKLPSIALTNPDDRPLMTVQSLLKLLGYDITQLGVLDDKTIAAMKAFYADQKITEPPPAIDNFMHISLAGAVFDKFYVDPMAGPR
jgi:N-acetyl-anhydromuramyl-L-alanine amidase AmpD